LTPKEEQKFLREALKSLESTSQSWSWPAFILEAIAFLGLAALALWITKRPGEPDWLVVALLIGTFIAGAILGSINLWRTLCRRGILIRPYIDQERIRARLAELEA